MPITTSADPVGSITVTRADVEAVLVRPLTSTEAQYVDALCSQAVTKMKAAIPGITTRVAAYQQSPTPENAIDPALVTAVLAGVVKRVLVNPQGAWSASQSIGPKSQSVTYAGSRQGGSADAPGALAITQGDIDQIIAPQGADFIAPGTIRTKQQPRGCW